MGLTKSSVGKGAIDGGILIDRKNCDQKIVALAGNPNVGKSTVFNALTGLHQHTGNWPGKTVANAKGYCKSRENSYMLVDIPGTYSLMANSVEEEIARDFICFGLPDAVAVVCDATCLERNLNLVLQIIEAAPRVVVCVNLMDEAKRKKIKVNIPMLSKILGVPVVGITARKKKTLDGLLDVIDNSLIQEEREEYIIDYGSDIEKAISYIVPVIEKRKEVELSPRWLALKLLDEDKGLMLSIRKYLSNDFFDDELTAAVDEAKAYLKGRSISPDRLKELVVEGIVKEAEDISRNVVTYEKKNYGERDRRIDKWLTSRLTGYPIMLAMLAVIFWITITGANYPSSLISTFLFSLQDRLSELLLHLGAPDVLHGILVLGVYRVLAWVVSVMLPPMAIFFPLFTILEDAGYLPRVAYNLDKPFCRCNACGKQALTMCMGFGCNAAGVVGGRIINSPRERLLAIITNSFVPCNGKFPMLISIITMFFIGASTSFASSLLSALMLTGIILLGIIMTFVSTKILSHTLLKGYSSSFVLELPPYRKPQFGKVIVRSVFDRTLFVLGRAIATAAPAGAIIWIMANVSIGDMSLLAHCADLLDPFARLLGLDGIILIAFVLGFPANEIVIPIIIMGYMSCGTIVELDSIWEMKELFVSNGWNFITAGSFLLFSLMHWPCSTTLMTIKKETGSLKWTIVAALLPTVVGMLFCLAFANIARLFL